MSEPTKHTTTLGLLRILASDMMILGVIHQRIDSFTQQIRQSPTADVWTVTQANRDSLPHLILETLEQKQDGKS